jgi:hypothetical protein
MATYEQIRADVLAKHGIYVQNCWIAHVKEMNGLTCRPAPNRRFVDARVKPCPDNARAIIETSMRHFKMI